MAIIQTTVEKLGSLKKHLPFLPGTKSEEEDRLVHLFRNRAGLKKQHSSLQDDFYDLKDRLKQQENSTRRVEEQLQALETLLGNPEAGYHALVFFQLRGLWRACHQQLQQFADELERQQDERERRKHAADFADNLKARLAEVDSRLAAAQVMEEDERQRLVSLEQQRARLKGFWNYFRRRSLAPQIERQRIPLSEARQEVLAVGRERESLEQEQCPPFSGLSIDGRRAINLAILACALVLGARLSGNGLAVKAREAINRRVNDAQFGSRVECEALMSWIAQALVAVRSRKEAAVEIKTSIDALRAVGRYRSDLDTVPLADTLGSVVPPGAGPGMALPASQILVDDYWYIYKVLLR